MSAEEWRPVPGWEGYYEVSNLGRVRSCLREVAGGNGSRAIRGGRTLKPSLTGGYEHVSLSRDNRISTRRVHSMVLEAFAGACQPGMHGCHYDGNPTNNRADNLYWGTPKENSRDRERHGTARYALKRGTCKYGHEWTEENTYLFRNGTPRCRTCHRADERKRQARSAA